MVGQTSAWRDFMPVEIFKQLNPHVNLDKYAK